MFEKTSPSRLSKVTRVGVTVVIPAYNEQGSLGPVLEELCRLMGEYELLQEIIVVDDASRDSTAEIANQYERVIVLRHRTNRGYGAALKTGIRHAQHDLSRRLLTADAGAAFGTELRSLDVFDAMIVVEYLAGRPDVMSVRAAGLEGLLKACRKVLFDRVFVQAYREKCRLMDPWIFHNRDGEQVRRIAEFMADIVVENQGVCGDNSTPEYNA